MSTTTTDRTTAAPPRRFGVHIERTVALLAEGRAFTPLTLAGELGIPHADSIALLRAMTRNHLVRRLPNGGAYLYVQVEA